MADVKVNKNSWLNITPLFSHADATFWDTPVFPNFPPSDQDVFVTINSSYAGRLDLIAHDYYGDVDLWWVIALVNTLDQVPSDVVVGLKLRLPPISAIRTAIGKGGSKT